MLCCVCFFFPRRYDRRGKKGFRGDGVVDRGMGCIPYKYADNHQVRWLWLVIIVISLGFHFVCVEDADKEISTTIVNTSGAR